MASPLAHYVFAAAKTGGAPLGVRIEDCDLLAVRLCWPGGMATIKLHQRLHGVHPAWDGDFPSWGPAVLRHMSGLHSAWNAQIRWKFRGAEPQRVVAALEHRLP